MSAIRFAGVPPERHPRLGGRGAPQAGQLPSGLGLIRDELENAEILLGGRGRPSPAARPIGTCSSPQHDESKSRKLFEIRRSPV
jgi:hypothetical protein